MTIDFKEIPPANSGADRDEFELFASDFLRALGLTVVEGPSRGADGGRDLIAEEIVDGAISSSTKRWLVSCKHFAHSGGSVRPEHEPHIRDRVDQHECTGFLAFYSTIPSGGLSDRLDQMSVETQIWSKGLIAERLVSNQSMSMVFRRYFPVSYRAWIDTQPSNMYQKYVPLPCKVCEQDLLLPGSQAIVVRAHVLGGERQRRFCQVYAVCKGNCDERMLGQLKNVDRKIATAWTDLAELKIPKNFVYKIVDGARRLREGKDAYANEAFEQEMEIILRIAQLAMRSLTAEEIEHLGLSYEL